MPAQAQPGIVWPGPEAENMYNTARTHLSAGQYQQAITAYLQAVYLAPDEKILYRDLGQAYYLSGNYKEADRIIGSLIDRNQADDLSYSIASQSKWAQKEDKDARKLLEKGLDKYPNSGMLYHELGRRADSDKKDEEALLFWLQGIQKDPDYRVNYYDAARAYMRTSKLVWAILYAETFINLERVTPRAAEARKMLLAAYERFFKTPPVTRAPIFGTNAGEGNAANTFEEAVQETLLRQASVVADGYNTENLTMLRARFITDWNHSYATLFPYALFKMQDVLLRTGHFDAYNQWLFTRAINEGEYKAWTVFNKDAIPAYEDWATQNPLLPQATETYNTKKVKDIFLKTGKQK